MGRVIAGRPLVDGTADGALLVSGEPLSFWGGYDATSGAIIDARHPLAGADCRGRVLAVPSTRGSSTTTAVLLEAIRAGTAPAALLTRGPDAFLALASIVADELYGTPIPVVSLDAGDYDRLRAGERARVRAGGRIEID